MNGIRRPDRQAAIPPYRMVLSGSFLFGPPRTDSFDGLPSLLLLSFPQTSRNKKVQKAAGRFPPAVF